MLILRCLFPMLILLGVLAPSVAAQRPIPRPAPRAAPPRSVPRTGPSEAQRRHQNRRDRLRREAENNSSGSRGSGGFPVGKSAKGKGIPVVPKALPGSSLSARARKRAARDFSLFELSGRRIRTEKVVGKLQLSSAKKPIDVVYLRHRERSGAQSVIIRHSTAKSDRPQFVLGHQDVRGRVHWWSAGGWRRRVRKDAGRGGMRLTGGPLKYEDFLMIQPEAKKLTLQASSEIDGVLSHQYRWQWHPTKRRVVFLDSLSRRLTRIDFLRGDSTTPTRRIQRLDFRAHGIHRRAHLWRIVDRELHKSATFRVSGYSINLAIPAAFFSSKRFTAAPF